MAPGHRSLYPERGIYSIPVMGALANKRVVLGVTGGIAAYKSADLVRRLREAGAEVRVVMTESATRFITALTLQALSGHRVHRHLFDADDEAAMGHIELARWADVVVVAPATANFMARLAHGMADDLLSTVCLAGEAPLALAPAMNRRMWSHPATRANAALLAERGVHLLGPAEGAQACGETGPGRMLEPEQLVALTGGLFAPGRLAGRRVLVTAGPTREEIDPVRYLTNRSSGKMGYAVAAAAAAAGADVTLVSGPVALAPPPGVRCVDVQSARKMYDAVMGAAADQDIVVAAAAVCDYRPRERLTRKLKKGDDVMALALEPTADIVAAVAALRPRPFVVGFAAETDALEANARAKLQGKGLDLVAANRVGAPDSGFDSDENELTVYWEGGYRHLPRNAKGALARQLMEVIAERYEAKRPTEDS